MSEQIKLTPARLRVLQAARDGRLYKSGRIHDLYTVYEVTDNGRRVVNRIVDDLRDAGLLMTGPYGSGPGSLDSALTLSESGQQRLAELEN